LRLFFVYGGGEAGGEGASCKGRAAGFAHTFAEGKRKFLPRRDFFWGMVVEFRAGGLQRCFLAGNTLFGENFLLDLVGFHAEKCKILCDYAF